MRLDKYVSFSLNMTRSNARKEIKNKKVLVNNVIVTKNDYYVLENDSIYYNNLPLVYKEYKYYIYNKPAGVICSNKDMVHKTIFDLIDLDPTKYFIVGRLDIDTTGLVLLTNDGDLTHKLTSPKKDIFKKYYVEVKNDLTNLDIIKFNEGVIIYLEPSKPYKTKSAKLEIITSKSCYVSISEGKYHQVKKMFLSIGNEVILLKRIQIDFLKLDILENELKELDEDTIFKLKEITKK